MKQIILTEHETAIVKLVSEWVKTNARWEREKLAGRFELCAPSEELTRHLTLLWQEMSKVSQRVGFVCSCVPFRARH